MKTTEIDPAPDNDAEVSALVEILLTTGRRLEELTGGEVDAVVDREGRTLLLRGVQKQLLDEEAAAQAAILNALPANIALLDHHANIVSVNDSWRRFAIPSQLQFGPGGGIGLNYVEVCENAEGPGSSEARLAAGGLRAVLAGSRSSYSLEYPFTSETEQSWYLLIIAPLTHVLPHGAIVMHLNITDRKQAGEALWQTDEKLRTLVVGVKDYAILMLDTDGRITTWNEGAERIKGYRAEEILGEHFSKFFPPESVAQGDPARHLKIASEQGRVEAEGLRVRKDGSLFWANVVISALRDENGRLRGFAKVTRDNTEQKQAESRLLLLTERLSLATAVAQVGVWEWELATNLLTWDATMFAIYGLPQAVSMTYGQWSATVHPEDLPKVEAQLRAAIDKKGDGSAEFRIFLPNGSLRNVFAVERAVLDQRANVVRVIGVNVDITERREAEEALRKSEAQMTYLAQHDFLTGLPNRKVLKDRLSQAIELARRNGKKAALLFMDMNGFKYINDSLGHPIGDKLLQSIAKRLKDCTRASDTVSREGGDEFLVLIPQVEHPEATIAAAKRLLAAVAKTHFVDNHDLHVTTCIGVSVYPDDGLDAETLIKNADTAMYQAKESVHPGYQFFHPGMNVRAVERQFLEENLRLALVRQELALHYQPIVDLRTGSITGAEALLRWTHHTRGPISPAQFIPVAEACGLILPIGAWVLREAATQARAWSEEGLPQITMAVNVSGLQFQSEDFLEGLFEVLDETGLDPRFLELEVTESLLMKRPDHTVSILHAVREKGVKVAVDDFGTGYSSLSYLTKLPLDTLKIDQSFVRQIGATPNGTNVLTAIIRIGESLNLKVVAEGVETAAELEFLLAQQCSDAQGYYFSRPVAAEHFVKLFEGSGHWMKPAPLSAA